MRFAILSVFLFVSTFLASAQSPVTGIRGDILHWIEDAEAKVVALAEAMPPEKYAWRPADGVRSVSEVFMHVATGNLGLPRMVGVEPPMKMERGMEKSITEKAKVIEMLKKSYSHVKEVVTKMSDSDLDKATKMFGNESTYRNVLMLITTHNHEHLGQSIAYARTNGITPPWSMKSE